jgi:hypothetical protein
MTNTIYQQIKYPYGSIQKVADRLGITWQGAKSRLRRKDAEALKIMLDIIKKMESRKKKSSVLFKRVDKFLKKSDHE